MTCIVALRDPATGRVVMGGDSAGVSGLDLTVRRDPKVGRVGEYLIGFTTSFRMGQLLLYGFTPPEPPEEQERLYPFMVTTFTDAVRKLLNDGGYAQIKDGKESAGCFLVAIRGRIFQIESDYQVGERIEDYAAVGCGESYAIGAFSFMEMEGVGGTLEQRVESALKIAAHCSAGVRAPFTVLALEPGEKRGPRRVGGRAT